MQGIDGRGIRNKGIAAIRIDRECAIAADAIFPNSEAVGEGRAGIDVRYAEEPFAQVVSEDARSFASSLTQPYCGVVSGVEAIGSLGKPKSKQ